MRVKGGNELILKPSAAKGNHGGRPKVIDDMATFARALKAKGVPVPEITKKLAIKTGKNAGQHPSVASVYRALAEAEEADAQTEAQIIGPRRAEAMGRRDYEDDPNAPAANSLVPAASAVVVDDSGRILLQRRRDNGMWALPGGATSAVGTPAGPHAPRALARRPLGRSQRR